MTITLSPESFDQFTSSCFVNSLGTITRFTRLTRIMQEIRIRVDWGPEKMP